MDVCAQWVLKYYITVIIIGYSYMLILQMEGEVLFIPEDKTLPLNEVYLGVCLTV